MSLTERQQKWFDSVKASFLTETGKTLEEWAQIAEACPESKHRARLAWFKQVHGLGQNRASIVLEQLKPQSSGLDSPLDQLWTDPASRAIYDAVEAVVKAMPDTVIGPRKSFVGLSRKVQFAAIRPLKGGGALLGLDAPPDADPRLMPMKRESWSERLKSTLILESPRAVDASVAALLEQAWRQAG